MLNTDNNNIHSMKIQAKKHTYNDFLKNRITNYRRSQTALFNELKDLPSFSLFHDKICDFVYNAVSKQYYNIHNKAIYDYKVYEEAVYGIYLDLYNEIPKKIKDKYKNDLKFKSIIKILNLTVLMNDFTFDPFNKEPVIIEKNKLFLNEYNDTLITQSVPATTNEEKEAIHIVINHIKVLIGYDKILDKKDQVTKKANYEFFIDWIAHQVQHPGKLLRFAPIIQSIQGAGKSCIMKLLMNMISEEYVQPISNEDLKSPFNFYVTNRLVNVVEELKIDGKKDDFVSTKLKEFIANDTFTINRKNIQQYTVKNRTNYLMLTNDKNCIPLEANERRYWIIYSPITKEDLIGLYDTAYFNKLHNVISQHKEVLRNYFLNHQISEEFKDCNIAPKTQASKELIARTKSNIVGFEEAQSLLSNPTHIYNKNIIISKEFFQCLEQEGIKGLNNMAKNKLLHELEYTKSHIRVRLPTLNKSAVFTIYVHNTLYDKAMDRIALIELFNRPFEETSIETP